MSVFEGVVSRVTHDTLAEAIPDEKDRTAAISWAYRVTITVTTATDPINFYVYVKDDGLRPFPAEIIQYYNLIELNVWGNDKYFMLESIKLADREGDTLTFTYAKGKHDHYWVTTINAYIKTHRTKDKDYLRIDEIDCLTSPDFSIEKYGDTDDLYQPAFCKDKLYLCMDTAVECENELISRLANTLRLVIVKCRKRMKSDWYKPKTM